MNNVSEAIKIAKERVLEFKSINSLLNFNSLVNEALNGKHNDVSRDLADKILNVYNRITDKIATQNFDDQSLKLDINNIVEIEQAEFNQEIKSGKVDLEVENWFKNSRKTTHSWIEDIRDLKSISSKPELYNTNSVLPLKSEIDEQRAVNKVILNLYNQVEELNLNNNKNQPLEKKYANNYNKLVELVNSITKNLDQDIKSAIFTKVKKAIELLPDANKSPQSFKMAIERVKNYKINHLNIKNIGMTKDEFVAIKKIADDHKIPIENTRRLDTIFKQQFNDINRELKIGLFMARSDGVECAKVINSVMGKCSNVDKNKLIKSIVYRCENNANLLKTMTLENKIMFLENIKSHQLKNDLIDIAIKTQNPEFNNYALISLPFNSSVANINNAKISDLLKVNMTNKLVDEKGINVHDLTFNEDSYSDYVESFNGNIRVRNEVTEHIVFNTVTDILTGNYPIPYYDGATVNELDKHQVDASKITEMVLNDSVNSLTKIDPNTKEYFFNILQIAVSGKDNDFEYISKNKIEGILNELSSNNHFEKQPQVVKNNVHPDFN